MSAAPLSSRAIIGSFYQRLEQDLGNSWIPGISMLFQSDQPSEEYKWLGMSPALREWVGGRQAKGFRDNGVEIKNKHFEATVEVLTREARRDKTGQVMVRINELADRANAHWASLLSTLIANGAATACYDGQYFFDTDHAEGSSGTLSNSISADISTYACAAHGSVTIPSVEEMQQSIMAGVVAMQGFKDDQGEPMNENAQNFLVMLPPSLGLVARNALAMPIQTSGTMQTPIGLNIAPVVNARLSAWTDKFAVFRTDGAVKPFVRQQETEVQIKAKAEGSEYEFDNDAWQFGIDTWRNVGYGYWQHACLVTMV